MLCRRNGQSCDLAAASIGERVRRSAKEKIHSPSDEIDAKIGGAVIGHVHEGMAAMTVGPGLASQTECGPMISAAAVGKIERLVHDAVERGAKLLCSGERPDREGLYFPPTALYDVSHDAALTGRKAESSGCEFCSDSTTNVGKMNSPVKDLYLPTI